VRQVALLLARLLAGGAAGAQERANFFNDPFVQATSGVKDWLIRSIDDVEQVMNELQLVPR
jgi:hypothetical protein